MTKRRINRKDDTDSGRMHLIYVAADMAPLLQIYYIRHDGR